MFRQGLLQDEQLITFGSTAEKWCQPCTTATAAPVTRTPTRLSPWLVLPMGEGVAAGGCASLVSQACAHGAEAVVALHDSARQKVEDR